MPHANFPATSLLSSANTWTGRNDFDLNIVAPFYDYPIVDSSGDSFNYDAGSTPSGWTEEDAAFNSNTNELYGFWYLQGRASETSFSYSKQYSFTSGLPSWMSAKFGPIIFRDGGYTADLTWYFAMHADDSGSPDADEYTRIALQWDSTNENFRLRGEYKRSATETLGSWLDVPKFITQPIYLRIATLMSSDTFNRAYVGTNPLEASQTALINASGSVGDYNNFHLRVSHTRGAGVDSYLYLGAVDFSGEA